MIIIIPLVIIRLSTVCNSEKEIISQGHFQDGTQSLTPCPLFSGQMEKLNLSWIGLCVLVYCLYFHHSDWNTLNPYLPLLNTGLFQVSE